MSISAKDIADLYNTIYRKAHVETGPRLLGKSGKYVSRKRLLAVGEPYVKDLANVKGHRIVEVPGAWHALCVAMCMQELALTEQKHHLLFRGQSNSSYPLVASIYRKGADEKVLDRAKKFLAWFLASNAGFAAAIDPGLFHGAAQHYQIWTNLLDVTPDPAVAVWFAAQPVKSECPTAAVYCLPLEAAERWGLNPRLPPPFVERLHRQRGLFIECNGPAPLPMDEVVEIRFPAVRYANKAFKVVRGGGEVRLLDDDNWIRKAVTWANEKASDAALPVPTRVPQGIGPDFALFLQAVKAAGIPAKVLDVQWKQLQLLQWLDYFNDQLYWLAYLFDDRTRGGEEVLEPRRLAWLVRANRDLARTYVSAGRQLGFERPTTFHRQLDLVERALATP